MKTEKEIREQIEKITQGYKHVLDCKLVDININAPRSLMQLTATVQLDALYWILEEERPRFKYDE